MSMAWVGLGSNLGDRAHSLRTALRLIEEEKITVLRASHLYESLPEGGADEPLYLNAVAQVETGRSPIELLRALRTIEERLGRPPDHAPGPRTCDLDLLAVDGRVCAEPALRLPHPRMHERVFVLVPLCEIDPHWHHPLLDCSAGDLLASLETPRRALWLFEDHALEASGEPAPGYPWHMLSPRR